MKPSQNGPLFRRPLFVARVVCAVSFVLLLCSSASAQYTIGWQRQPSAGPIARIEDTMVYDSAHARMIMFGGYDLNFNRMNDLWEYDPATQTWTNRTPSPLPAAWPSRRSGHTMAYDAANQRVVMFGGWSDNGDFLNGTHLNDTWEWNTNTKVWTNVTPSGTKPFARRGARMVYDSARSRIVMFGGNDAITYYPNSTPFGTGQDAATWIWNTTARTWTAQTTTSSSSSGRYFGGRTFHGMVYNSVRNTIWIYGGVGIAAPLTSAVDLGDVWEFNAVSNVWTDITPATSPAGRSYAGVQFDPVSNRMIVHAGYLSVEGIDTDDTQQFVYNGGTAGAWTQLVPAPGTPMNTRPLSETFARDSHAMVFDPAHQTLVEFGGYFADVPAFNISTNLWTPPTGILTTYWPPQQDGHSLVYVPGSDSLYMMGAGAPELYEGKLATLAWTTNYVPLHAPVSPEDSRTGEGVIYDSQRQRIVLFGGRQKFQGAMTPSTVFGDTYEWDLSAKTWTARATSGPSARYDVGMAYDAAHGQTILFGGRDAAGTPLAETWLWNGNSWTKLLPASSPSARFGHAMSYDPMRGVIVLFGGSNGSLLADTWEWNGSGWAPKSPAVAPPARAFAAMSPFDAATAGVAVFGGATGSSTLANDMWIWTGAAWIPVTASGSRPTPRQGARAAFDTAAQRIVLYGGRDGDGEEGDLWVGAMTRRKTSGDFDGDGKSDVTIYRPATGVWYVLQSSTNNAGHVDYQWGVNTDKPVPGDYDGDGKTDVAIYRPATGVWYVLLSTTNFASFVSYQWGVNTDIPVPADYDSDGKTDIAIYRPPTGVWYVLLSTTNSATYISYQWGVNTDIPVPGDYDGDRKADIAVYRPATGIWYVLLSTTNSANFISYQWGVNTDIPVSADYDGDGKADVAVYRPATGSWYILLSTTNSANYISYQWGVNTDIPVPTDYDGDGKADVAVYRPANGNWLVLLSTTNSTTFVTYQWGVSTDVPVFKRP
jgi:hypothetical protein